MILEKYGGGKMSNNRKITLVVMSTLFLLAAIIGITYSFFTADGNNSNNILYNVTFSDSNYNFTVNLSNVSDVGGTMSISSQDMYYQSTDSEAGSYSNAFDITFINSSNEKTSCLYDYIWVWDTDGYDNYVASSEGIKEYTVYSSEIGEQQVPNYNSDSFVVGSGKITAAANSTTTRIKSFTVKMYNLSGVDQLAHKGKNYKGYLAIAHVKCGVTLLTDYLAADAPRSGTSAVGGSAWILTSDRTGEWRYAGKNPDNYVQFNGELWRIIGVMPNMEYCTGTYGTESECDTTSTGSLVKIIRNQTISSSTLRWDYKISGVGSSTSNNGSNDWSDSQLMLMLNGTNYLKTGYDANGNKLHQSYTITSNVVAGNGYNYYNATYSYLDGSGTTVYKPSIATTSSYTATSGSVYKKIESSALNQIATVKWDLYGTNSYTTAAEGSPAAFYNKERNINYLGSVYTGTAPENWPVYWYGKIGLMYPSDYGYATNGGSTYNRDACLGYQMYGWSSGDYKTDCALNSYLLFQNIKSTAPGTSGANQWTITPNSSFADIAFRVTNNGYVTGDSPDGANAVRPTLYLKSGIVITGGTGTWNDPYTISSEEYSFGSNPKKYWHETNGIEYTYPSYAGTLYSDGLSTGRDVYMGQDNSKYYACATISGNELCLSQPYTQYGLSRHDLYGGFTSSEQASAKQAIYQIFIDAGIDITMDNCGSEANNVSCTFNNISLSITPNGIVDITNFAGMKYCRIDANGRASCGN